MLRKIASALIVGILGCAVAGGAQAQDAAAPAAPAGSASGPAVTCSFGGIAFSPGTMLPSGSSIVSCAPGGFWYVQEDAKTVNCLYASYLYSPGAPVVAGTKTVTCQADGSWK